MTVFLIPSAIIGRALATIKLRCSLWQNIYVKWPIFKRFDKIQLLQINILPKTCFSFSKLAADICNSKSERGRQNSSKAKKKKSPVHQLKIAITSLKSWGGMLTQMTQPFNSTYTYCLSIIKKKCENNYQNYSYIVFQLLSVLCPSLFKLSL